MLAFGLTLLVFVFWTGIGYTVLTLLYRQNHLLQNALLAPVVGMATTLLPVFWINRLGVPVGQFGIGLTIVLALSSAGVLWFVRPKFPWRDYLPFAIVFVIALFLTGRPMLEFGFNWASFSNADQMYYALSAQRFLDNGYFQPPGIDQFNGRDYTFAVWGLQSQGHRTGSDLLLSWGLSVTNLRATQAYMPMILAFHLSLISSSGALILQSDVSRKKALLYCSLLSISALTTLGTLYQLFAQVSGLALLIGCTVLLLHPGDKGNRLITQHSLISAILVSALLITYPEVFPFLILSLLLYTLVNAIQKRLVLFTFLRHIGIVFALTLVGVNIYLWDSVRFFNTTTSEKILKSVGLTELVFPYYLVPSGLADLWGLRNMAVSIVDPWLSLSILIGILLLTTTVVATIWLLKRGQSIAVMTAVMLTFGILLFFRTNDFGLFKLAMFSQPFLLGTLMVAEYRAIRHRTVTATLLVVLFCLPNLLVQFSYVETSKGEISSGFVEIPHASPSRLYTELEEAVTFAKSDHLLFENPNVSLTGLLFLYAQGKSSASINLDSDYAVRSGKSSYFKFDIQNGKDRSEQNAFLKNIGNKELQHNISIQPDALLIAATSQQGLFNRWKLRDLKKNVVAIPFRQVSNHLVFTPSKLGKTYYGYIDGVSFFQLESDFFIPQKTIVGIGRHFLFEVLNPSEQGRLVLEMTASLKSDGENKLPPANAIGKTRELFPIVGRGSARVFSAPVAPQVIDGGSYVAIDMGVEPKAFPNVKTGLMKLYGSEIPADSRKLVGFGRDISLISPQEYSALIPPNSVSSFPNDLTNRSLEYSGIYEDGWLSEAAFLGLSQPNPATPLVIRGTVPGLSDPKFVTELRVSVDGQEIAQRTLKPGDFNLKITIPKGQKRRRVDLRFSKWQNLPNSDKRPVAAKLSLIGFTTDEKS